MTAASVHLIGGGWEPEYSAAVYGGFLDEAAAVAARSGRPGKPIIACVVFDEGDGRAQFGRWERVLTALAFCEPVPILVDAETPLDVSALGNADALLVCGGLTPGYAGAVAPAAVDVLDWLLLGGRPYAGFSAGSAVASASAVVGGWLSAAVPICPDNTGEELEEISVRPGLGVVPFLVDVHCAQWGTLTRLIEAVRSTAGAIGMGIDENTVLVVNGGVAVVRGRGQVWRVAHNADSVTVNRFRAGEEIPLH